MILAHISDLQNKVVVAHEAMSLLWVEHFKTRYQDPIQAAKTYAEVLDRKMQASKKPDLPASEISALQDEVNAFFAQIVARLRLESGGLDA